MGVAEVTNILTDDKKLVNMGDQFPRKLSKSDSHFHVL